MAWRTIIVTQHAKISYSGQHIVIQTRDGIQKVPISDVQILLISTTQAVITSAAISELARQQAKVIFTDKTAEPICETVGYYPNSRTPNKIIEQVNWDVKKQENLWTKIVFQKIKNQIQVAELFDDSAVELNKELDKLELGDLSNREAVVARKYFSLMFEGSRRDLSVTNAALNYGYSILLSAVNREIVVNGYQTQLGIHHHSQENEFNLGSDLMEPFRPIVDGWVKQHQFKEFNTEVKYGLVRLLDFEFKYGGQNTILRNAITKHVANCLKFLSGELEQVEIGVEINEVSDNAFNGDV